MKVLSKCSTCEHTSCWECETCGPRYKNYKPSTEPVIKGILDQLEEASMENQKPRICEVLGVEPKEKFDAGSYKDAYVDSFGIIRTNIGSRMDADRVCELINHPDRIIRKPRWTEQEVEIAKVLYDFRRSESVVIGRNKGGALWWRDGDSAEGILPNKLFPSLNECNSVKLSEIYGGAE